MGIVNMLYNSIFIQWDELEEICVYVISLNGGVYFVIRCLEI